MTRREERELLATLVFELPFYNEDEYPTLYDNEQSIRDFNSDYAEKCFEGIVANLRDIDAKIAECAISWKLSRLSKIILALFRVAVYEMIYLELPYTIAINEAVELAKKYDDDKAPGFVNGVLNKIAEINNLK